MPRLVDHSERRRSIIVTTWRIIAEQGIENASMRDIARECGYAAPGVLAHYFPNKDSLLLAAYELICERTNERVAACTKDRRGLSGLQGLCLEIIPANPLTVVEARVAVSFWQRAQTEASLRAVGRQALMHWRDLMLEFLAQAEHDGECAPLTDPDSVADELLNIMMGLHVTSMLDPDAVTGSRQRYLMERALSRLIPINARKPDKLTA
ncbi:TetR/AcrR family transcriptional regulator [Pseudarthrobacter sp. NamE5]|uniref:TetR/AcrR family transcriptional regulator n=1 Tax=Pseudarthrobacter sp. NamE5 TaxID=2576839 RepID=UPI00110B730E|nr:TetR/AcrR family transcriptional regulator [Pseudarthrobacter sp. NamE5]TLM88241.1 TetR/AcrR family transcriptional regulator [Pseudarthrobacter sp. NamE5]